MFKERIIEIDNNSVEKETIFNYKGNELKMIYKLSFNGTNVGKEVIDITLNGYPINDLETSVLNRLMFNVERKRYEVKQKEFIKEIAEEVL